MQSANPYELPANLPKPQDDGACSHLQGQKLPFVTLMSTRSRGVNLSTLPGKVVIYCYPRTAKPGEPLPTNWDLIPGARGCTPQTCGFKDHYQELQRLKVRVFGLSTQSPEEQEEVAQRLHLPFELLSDSFFRFQEALKLPIFEVDSLKLIKRLTLIAFDGVIQKVFYPVFPPDQNAEEVKEWLEQFS